MSEKCRKNVCKSVFKNKECITTKEAVTQKWIELINVLENQNDIMDKDDDV